MILIDTHVLVWLIQGDRRIGSQAFSVLEEAIAGEGLFVSAITPWEISMLADKGRLSLGKPTAQWVSDALAIPGFHLVPVEPLVAVAAGELPGSIHGDPADRLIIATARNQGYSLATADRDILDYAARGHVTVIDARK